MKTLPEAVHSPRSLINIDVLWIWLWNWSGSMPQHRMNRCVLTWSTELHDACQNFFNWKPQLKIPKLSRRPLNLTAFLLTPPQGWVGDPAVHIIVCPVAPPNYLACHWTGAAQLTCWNHVKSSTKLKTYAIETTQLKTNHPVWITPRQVPAISNFPFGLGLWGVPFWPIFGAPFWAK